MASQGPESASSTASARAFASWATVGSAIGDRLVALPSRRAERQAANQRFANSLNTASSVKVGIVGASGYSGEELVRLLLRHPHVELAAVTSRQYAGQTVAQVFPKFAHHPRARSLRFTKPESELLAKQAQVIFLALPHGVA